MASTTCWLLPFHKQFPDKLRSQTMFGQYEKIYRRPPTLKKNSKEFTKLQSEEKIKLSKVADFRNIANNQQQHQENIHLLSSINAVKMYGYKRFPGLYFIPNYLSIEQQYEWIKESVEEFSNAPYNNLTNLYKQQNKSNLIATWQDAIKQNDFTDFRKLTWCNVGIQYDWTERRYNLDNITAPIPSSMLNLCNHCNHLLSNIKYDDEQKEDGLTFSMTTIPQTSIINFFEVNTKRPMGGHRDAAELINAPLISVSLGNNAIFLISKHDNIEPLPLWVRSGDILIMAGKARFALHCVARVVANTCSTELIEYFDQQNNNNINKKELELMKQYIMESRINFNIRQVIDAEKLPSNNNHCDDNDDSNHLTMFHEIHSF